MCAFTKAATLRGEARGATFGAAAVGVLSRFSELKVMVTGPGKGEIGGGRSLPGGHVYRTCTYVRVSSPRCAIYSNHRRIRDFYSNSQCSTVELASLHLLALLSSGCHVLIPG